MSIAASVKNQLIRRKGSLFLLFFSDLLFYLSKVLCPKFRVLFYFQLGTKNNANPKS